MNKRICRKCKVEKKLIRFRVGKKAPGGHSTMCKACMNEKNVTSALLDVDAFWDGMRANMFNTGRI